PRLPIQIEPLPRLGSLIIRANNQKDLEAALKIIETLQKHGAGAELQLHLAFLQHADATSVSTNLGQLFQRLTFTPFGTTATAGATPFGQGQIAVQGTPSLQQAAGSVTLLPLPRFNAILVAAPKARMADVLRQIVQLDRAKNS